MTSHEGWIKCSERMPDEGDTVALIDSNHNRFYGGALCEYRNGYFYLLAGLEASNYDGSAEIVIDFRGYEFNYWMKITPPQESRDDKS